MKTAIQLLQSCQDKLKTLENMIPTNIYSNRILEIDSIMNSKSFWSDNKSASTIAKERVKISTILESLSFYKNQLLFLQEVADLIPEDLNLEANRLAKIEGELIEIEFQQILSDPIDNNPAILTISAGAGGLEAANWVTMLLRMYCRYAEANSLEVDLLDMKPSEEHASICTDSVSLRIAGPYAYGFLKGEAGVHRLIRNSPFNSGDARHTSFAAVAVTPDIEDTIDIKVLDKDLEITAQTAGGPGGQHQNRTKSAVRVKHIPTGISLIVRAERDQHANKKTALKMLKSKLYDLEQKKRQKEEDKFLSQLADAAFGNQIRTYTETPYSLVTDHRTGIKDNSFESVIDGEIGNFLRGNLNKKL